MSFLNALSEEDLDLFVRLPYRVGLWVSKCDSTGGEVSDAEELQTLSNLLEGIAREIFGAETVQHIITRTIAARDRWDDWDVDLDNVLDECRRAMTKLEQHVDPKEVNAFRQHLFEIGEAVALAFREYNEEDVPLIDRIRMHVLYYLDTAKARKQGMPVKTKDEYFNISLYERAALAMLREHVGLDNAD